MIIYCDVIVFKLQGLMDRLSSSMVCILVEDKNIISSLCMYDCSKSADPEPGDFIVINTLSGNGAFWENIRDDAHITSGNAVVGPSVN